jgi:uncharacterized C2H2 Zn-finger protein
MDLQLTMSVIDIIFICFIGSGLTLTLITIRQRKANKYLQDLSSATKIVTKNEYSEIGIAMRAGEYLVKCPDCAEFIKLEANVCKNCNRDVSTFTHTKREELANLSELKSLARESKDAANKSTGIRVAVVFLVVLGSYLLFNFVSTAISNNKTENSVADRTSSIDAEYSKWSSAVTRCGYAFRIDKDYVGDSPLENLYVGTQFPIKEMKTFWTTDQGKALDCFSSAIYGLKLSAYFSVNDTDALTFKDRWLYDAVFSDASIKGETGQKNTFYNADLTQSAEYSVYTISLYWNVSGL